MVPGAGYYHSMAIAKNGDLFAWGCNNYGQLGTATTKPEMEPALVRFPPTTKIVEMAGGGFHSLAVSTYAMLPCCASIRRISTVFLVVDLRCVCRDGIVFSWGLNRYGQLGMGDTADALVPVVVDVFGMIS